jgi:hypothetical protein
MILEVPVVNRFEPLPWNDGAAGGTPASVARGPRRWEKGLDDIDAGLDSLEDRVDAIQAALGSLLGNADVMPTSERLTTAPTEGKLVVDSDLPALLIGKPGGAGWWKVDLTTLSGAGGGGSGATAPVLAGELQAGGTIGQIVLTATGIPAGATAVTFRESRSPNGVSGMPVTATSGTATTTRTPGTTGGYDYWVTYTLAGVESPASNHFVTTLPYTDPGGGGGGGGATGTPASILNIGTGPTQNHFNVGVGYSTGHVDHTQAEIIGGYAETPYFQPNAAGDAVQFSVFANGKTTSNLTGHPRSELRELLDTDAHKASWGPSGTHTMSGTTRIVSLPADNLSTSTARPWICFGQIHDTAVAANGTKGGDIVRLQMEGNFANGFVLKARTHTPNGEDGIPEVVTTLQSSYTVGNDINWKIQMVNGVIKIYIDNVVKATINGITSNTCYFKAGNYSQFSTVSSDGGYPASARAVVELRNLVVTHSG